MDKSKKKGKEEEQEEGKERKGKKKETEQKKNSQLFEVFWLGLQVTEIAKFERSVDGQVEEKEKEDREKEKKERKRKRRAGKRKRNGKRNTQLFVGFLLGLLVIETVIFERSVGGQVEEIYFDP